jgi:hypothetical protein
MKKIFTFISAIILAIGTMSLTSCDEDESIGLTLDGSWAGDLYAYATYGGYTYYANYSEVEFITDPFSYASGTGYWVDYYSNAPWDYYASHIRWNVVNGRIRIYFVEDDYIVDIYDYVISDYYFSGNIEGEDGKWLSFRLRNADPVDWGSYGYGWDVWSYGYSKKMDGTRSAPIEFEEGEKPVRHIGHKGN